MKRKSLFLSFMMVIVLIAISGCTDFIPGTQTGSITGTVQDAKSQPISGALIEIENTTKAVNSTSAGYFSFENLSTGSYTIKATKDGFESASRDVTVTAGQTTTVDLKLQPVAPTTGTIVGSVVEKGTTTPVVGATVQVDGTSITTTTDNNGGFTFTDLEYKTYTLLITKDGFTNSTKTIKVDAEEVTANIELEKILLGAIQGTVVIKGSTTPVGGATVQIDGTSTITTTDSNGGFTFTGLDYDTYSLIVTKDGFINKTQDVIVNTEQVAATIELEEILLGDIHGTVVMMGTITPIADATVQIGNTSIITTTDSNGEFTIADLEYDTYSLLVTKDGFINKTQGVIVNTEQVTTTIELEETAAPMGDIHGIVSVLGTSLPIEGATVQIAGTSINTVTDSQGSFVINNLDYDTYSLTISKTGYYSITEEVIVDAEEVTMYFELEVAIGSIQGTVVTSDSSQPISGVAVQIEGTSIETYTDSQGSFMFSNLEYGTYTLSFSKDGFALKNQDVVVDTSEVTVNISLDEVFGKIQGAVVDNATQEPINGATVQLEGTSSVTFTDSQGYFMFENLRYGTYNIVVSNAGYETAVVNIIVDSEQVNANIDLIPSVPESGDIVGSVVIAGTTEPLESATVQVDGTSQITTTDVFGEFTLTDLDYGTYSLTVTKDGYTPLTQEVILNQPEFDITFELAEIITENPAKNMVDNFKTSMYQVGTIAIGEENVIANNLQTELVPFFDEVSPNLVEFANGLGLITYGIGYAPGEYSCDIVTDSYGYYDWQITQISAGDLNGDTLSWTFYDNYHDQTIELSTPNIDNCVSIIDTETDTQITIDLTGAIFNAVLTPNYSNAQYTTTITIGDTNVQTFTYSESWEDYDGTIYTNTITMYVPSGPTAELNLLIDADNTDGFDEIAVNGILDISSDTEDSLNFLIFALEGDIVTDVCTFSGGIELDLVGPTTDLSNIMYEPLPFGICASGRFETSAYTASGEVIAEFDTVEGNLVPCFYSLDTSYSSDTAHFNGLVRLEFTNYEEYYTSLDPSVYLQFQADFDGWLNTDSTDYQISLTLTNPLVSEYHVDLNLTNDDFTMSGPIVYHINDIENIMDFDLTDGNGTNFNVSVPDFVREGDIVGSIIQNGTNYATVSVTYQSPLGTAFIIEYTDGSWETIPLNPAEYLTLPN